MVRKIQRNFIYFVEKRFPSIYGFNDDIPMHYSSDEEEEDPKIETTEDENQPSKKTKLEEEPTEEVSDDSESETSDSLSKSCKIVLFRF
jgi:hypothetical protein